MQSKDIIKGNLDLIILTALEDGEKYGYEITKTVLSLTDGHVKIKEGSLYPALHKLEKQEYIEGFWVHQEPGKPDRKYYRITARGLETVNEERGNWRSYVNIMGRVFYGKEYTGI